MKLKVVVHEADEGGYWGEMPAIPGCASQGETVEELMANLHEAIEGCLAVDVAEPRSDGKERILEIAVSRQQTAKDGLLCHLAKLAEIIRRRDSLIAV
jgi:predicted RNase H-like HicB family nuclease